VFHRKHQVPIKLPAVKVAARATGDRVGATREAGAAGGGGRVAAIFGDKRRTCWRGVSVTLSITAVAVLAVELLVAVSPTFARESIVTTVGVPSCVHAPGEPEESDANDAVISFVVALRTSFSQRGSDKLAWVTTVSLVFTVVRVRNCRPVPGSVTEHGAACGAHHRVAHRDSRERAVRRQTRQSRDDARVAIHPLAP